MNDITMFPIGVIHTPLFERNQPPIQSSRSDVSGTVEVYSKFVDGLDGLVDFSHIYLLYAFHLSELKYTLKVQPFLDDQVHGVFATRYPCRPNPIGLSIVRLVARRDNLLLISGADMLDGTPLLDIKPYIPEFDVFSVNKIGWYKNRKFS